MTKRRSKRSRPLSVRLQRQLTAANDLLAETRRRLEQTETLLSDSEERYVKLQESSVYHQEKLKGDVRRLVEELMNTSRRLHDAKDANVITRQAAAVLALHLVGQNRPAELLQSLEMAAADFGVSPERFDGFKGAVSQALNEAFSFYTSTQWSAQRAADSTAAPEAVGG